MLMVVKGFQILSMIVLHPSHRLGENLAMQPSASTEWHQSDPCNPSALPPNCSSFPKSAKMFMDAIKKNRSCQRFLRSKLVQIEAKIEQNKKLKDRVKILKDFQVSCKKRTGRALSQKKDPRVLLISMKKSSASKDSATGGSFSVQTICFLDVEEKKTYIYIYD
ncbi:uncharacterized protein LOC132800439 [Ziziphus jujuba]|uniref:Uncharacterized protein LOC132800439 n=1 Tax=Ziziphus jujuba TaxID=326968 RepID=A0ABM4A008_ZIZJJ|nr:uncharacterized protein LOC132800439 [Ziziphus jujuba]